ncbi:MFS transporter [Bacillus mesophilus]|uniref:MFS transporter n=1 Tax=Bacillus mesophilus TaxID=1808955 RepID=A0A6M0Q8Y9_9BACI|nr:MFS transporter [Bacillus mesophilus]NEY71478.1 MFS transporter [Bacillus mesophilus]
MDEKRLRLLVFSQSMTFFASSLIFPFYILFLKNVGSSFSAFGLSYGIFGLSSAFIYLLLGKISVYIENRYLLLINCWGMALILLTFPHVTTMIQVYSIQVVLGIFGAFQKHGEKILLANYTDQSNRGGKIGNYHFWTTLFSSVAIISAGFLADFFTIDIIFYSSSILYLISGYFIIPKKTKAVV